MESSGIIGNVAQTLAEFEDISIHYDPRMLPETPGRFEPVETTNLCDEIKRFVASQYPSGLFTHQHRAIEHVMRGDNTVVATRTSSGKSLIYSLPVLDSLCHDADSTALFLYPQKALANDQLIKLREAVHAIPSLRELAAKSGYLVSRYDGATDDDEKPEIRASVQLLLTNPDMLHFSMLQWHEKHWGRLFSNLKYVIVDECHEYRGIFGTNVAYILRRLRQLCQMYGSCPSLIATSATVAQPQTHLETLVGLPFTCVGPDEDGSRQGARKFWMVSSDDHFYDFGRKLTMQLAEQGLSVLAFCRSRMAAERLMSRTIPGRNAEPDYVRVYRAGLSAKDREEIERGLRDKTVRVVYSTSALELGIDIGAIDVVLCIGLPNSMMSLWQRAGRATRSGKEGAVVLIPADTPIDSYYADSPSKFFARDHEPLVLNLTNRRVVHQHYACAVQEVGNDEELLSLDIVGDPFSTVKTLRSDGKLDEVEIFYQNDPHMELNIRSMGEGAYTLELDRVAIGEIDSFHLLREAYRNAIYRHGGQAYRVQGILKRERKVRLRRDSSGHETSSYIQKQIRLKRRYSYALYSQMTIATVGIDAKEFIVNVVEKDRAGKTTQSWPGNAGMPEYRLPTDGTRLHIHREAWDSIVGALGQQMAQSALQSCERLLWSLFPTVTGPCDTQDFSSASQVASDGGAEIYLYDLVYDGADLAIGAFERMPDLLQKALERLCDCDCVLDEGCFRCIANPRIEEATSKIASRQLLETLATADQILIHQWIAFNALYGQWDVERHEPLADRESWQVFLGRMLELDTSNHIVSLLTEHKGLTLTILGNGYLNRYFWQEPCCEKAARTGRGGRHKAESWYVEECWTIILEQVFERVYLLRCQLMHGAATLRSKLNRTALRHCTQLMWILLPAFLLVWIDHGLDEDRGIMCYPPVHGHIGAPDALHRPSRPR